MNRWIIPAVMACTLATGCATAPRSAPRVETLSMDSAITEQVRDEIAHAAPESTIQVHTDQGKVELRGDALDAEQARLAMKTALRVEGVRGVVNEMNIAPPQDTLQAASR